MTRPRRILYLVDEFGGSTWYRCHVPGEELKKRGYEVKQQDKLTQQDLEYADTIILQRLYHPDILRAAEYAKSLGKMVVFDTDDDYWCLDSKNPAWPFWTVDRLAELAAVMKCADVITTPTEPLKERLKLFNKNIYVLPNMLPDAYWPQEKKNLDHDAPLIIGWAGSSSHRTDMIDFESIIPQILNKYPNVEMHFCGANLDWFSPQKRMKILKPVQVENYASIVETFDIGVAPVRDVRFNEAKSDLKVLEYGIIGMPVIASKVPPYIKSVQHGETGFLTKNSAKDWLKHLKIMIESPELRLKMGEAGRRWAEKRLMSKNIDLWEAIYNMKEIKDVAKPPQQGLPGFLSIK